MNKMPKGARLIFFLCAALIPIISLNSLFYADNGRYPKKIEVIDKSQATYNTPEDALTAGYSASVKGDLKWFYETLTKASVKRFKSLAEEAGWDPRDFFKGEDASKQSFFILRKTTYKDAVVLVNELRTRHHIYISPSAFIRVDGEWKRTDAYMDEKDFLDFLDYKKADP